LAAIGTFIAVGALTNFWHFNHLAIAAAKDVARAYGRPIQLDIAVRFLPVVAEQRPEDYDRWALRWLARWSIESPRATIEQAAEVAASLADLPAEPTAIETIRQAT